MYQSSMLHRKHSWLSSAITVLALVSAGNSDAHQSFGPIILPAKSEITLHSGQNFTMICKGNDSNIRFKHQESNEDKIGDFVMKETNLSSSTNGAVDEDYKYSIALDLINVDTFAVGYYACFDSTVNSNDLLNNILEEPTNTEHVSYIYVYVNGSYLHAPMRTIVSANSNSSKFLIECKPTAPDVNVKLTLDFADIDNDQYTFSDKLGFTIDIDAISQTLPSFFKCVFMRDNIVDSKDVVVHKYIPQKAPKPTITSKSKNFLRGETFSLNCTVSYKSDNAVELTWSKIPGPLHKVSNVSNKDSVRGSSELFNNITISDASEEDAGDYFCTSQNMHDKKTVKYTKQYLDKPLLKLTPMHLPLQDHMANVTVAKGIKKRITVESYPLAFEIALFKDNVLFPVPINGNNNGLKPKNPQSTDEYILTLFNLEVTDSGNYTVRAKNEHAEDWFTVDLRVKAAPRVYITAPNPMKYLKDHLVTGVCEVTGYPPPVVNWEFSTENEEQTLPIKDQIIEMETVYKLISEVRIQASMSGNITCSASNSEGSNSTTRQFLVYEMDNGFGIKEADVWFWENQNATLTCIASKYDFSNLTWTGPEDNYMPNVVYAENELSHVAQLYWDKISTNAKGYYTCIGWTDNTSNRVKETIFVPIEGSRPLEITNPEKEIVEVFPFHPVNLTCTSDAVPPPELEWYKDAKPLHIEDPTNEEIITTNRNHTTAFSMLKIFMVKEENIGEYQCRATSGDEVMNKFYSLVLMERSTNLTLYMSVIGGIVTILIILIVYLCWVNRKEKRFRKELAAAGLLYFKEGVTKSINPELGISEQAELLPYDEKFEFPPDKLVLGKQLGAGAFGVVYKAEARGIVNAEETTTVAVKMVKKTADNMYIKALASELKIMVHLGKHINIVNLLGACTKNVGKRELSVIVEYCCFGNIHRYLQQHRDVFIDTLNDNPDKVLGKVNKGYSSTSANSGATSDYFGSSNHTQNTGETFLNTANTNRSGRKASETGYIQPEWRSNYESDYSFEGRIKRPLLSRDLLCWAFQIARGMEYLASRKVLHGDLAARNILLAEDNVVKICDFGLARSIYKNDEYHKKENSPLPVKWLAIECISDGIFSTQSDVWSFGIVLWELFSLAKTPYPNLSNDKVYPWLCEGNRLKKPEQANDKLYDVMRRCWEQKPTVRPSFSQLQEIIGSFLDENVRNHYVDLNDPYMSMNLSQQRETEDYLAMMTAPDYTNQLTPSAHDYVNETRTFVLPDHSQLEHDDQGYLQMSPTRQPQPRAQNPKFDFDDRRMTSGVSDGSELTPMLTLNNLPRCGSESDHEDSQNAPSYLNVCPKIEEENDNVFELKQNNKFNSQASAVTNPTYTFQFTDRKV